MGLFKDRINRIRKPEVRLGKMVIKGINSDRTKMAERRLLPVDEKMKGEHQ